MKQLLFLLLVTITLAAGCNRETQTEIDRDLIIGYLEENNLDAIEDDSGLFYIVDSPGSEEKPALNDEVTVWYKGYRLNGTVFDEVPEGETRTFPLNRVIAGWQLGIPKFGRGGSGLLLIPSHLGYGNRWSGGIPPNSVLVFEVGVEDF